MNSHETNLAFDIRPVLIKEESFDEVTPTVYINNEGQLCLHINFNRKHYRQSEMETVGKLFSVLITEMVNKPNAPIVSLSRVSEADLPALMSLSKGEELAYDTSKIRLINQGIELNDFVAVKMGRVKEFAVAIVGIHLTRIFAISNVGYGYWSRPEMTNAVFGDCAFVSGMQMYHTGDLGYYDKNGRIMFFRTLQRAGCRTNSKPL